jgi:glycerol-3-phosphate dehydrogenase
VRLEDRARARGAEVRAKVVINATGAWADRLRGAVGAKPRIRPLRGSHLLFPAWRFPIAQAMTFLHTDDHRPIFVIPWEGATLVGTTDVDHPRPLDEEPAIGAGEARYLMAGLAAEYPSLGLGANDVVASFAGVRPVIGSGKANPSEESRDHAVWQEHGLLTVTGGKLTTFRLMALDALKEVWHRFPATPEPRRHARMLDAVNPTLPGAAALLDDDARRRLLGRYGADASPLIAAAMPRELEPIAGTHTLWAELRWAARNEGVVHLEDLLLRRVRLGLLVPDGGGDLLPGIRACVQNELGWSDARWDGEAEAYRDTWEKCYSPP